MTYEVVLTASTVNDLYEIVDFIAMDNEKRAVVFADQLQERMRRMLSSFPGSGTAIGSYRFTVFSGYVVVYAIEEVAARVDVVMVTEGHRDWQTLLKDRG
jgi:plasmid stabilization system protein ParE